MPDFESHQDQTLGDMVNGKKLSFITFTGFEHKEQMDEDDHIKETEHSVSLKVVKQPSNRAGYLRKLKEKYLERGYEVMRIAYKEPQSFGKQVQKIIKLDRKQDAATALFNKQDEVTLGVNLAQCEEKLVDELCAKMVAIIEGAKKDALKKLKRKKDDNPN